MESKNKSTIKANIPMCLWAWNEGGNYNESNVDKRSWRCEEGERNPRAICSDSAKWVVGKVESYLDTGCKGADYLC